MIIILVAFVGQTNASHFMPSSHNGANHQVINSDLNNSHIPIEENVDCCDFNCCDTSCSEASCVCSANNCFSYFYLDYKLNLSAFFVSNEPILSLNKNDAYFIATSLLRPPIFTL